MSAIYGLVFRLMVRCSGSWLARLWHRVAPSVPVVIKVFGIPVLHDSRDTCHIWLRQAGRVEDAEGLAPVIRAVPGPFWDVGCNTGAYALLHATTHGDPVACFDISKKAIAYVRDSFRLNGLRLRFQGHAQALTVAPVLYDCEDTLNPGNRMRIHAGGSRRSMTVWEAAFLLGTPRLIKMDIEGGEEEFLRSRPFLRWLSENGVVLVVEVHRPEFEALLVNSGLPYRKLGQRGKESHWVVNGCL